MFFVLSIFFILKLNNHAQSLNYSDPFFEKGIFNPALSGISECLEINAGYKMNITHDFMSLSYHQYFDKFKTGAGILIRNLSEGNGGLNTVMGGLTFNHMLNIKTGHKVNFGFRIDYIQIHINNSELIFSNQIDPYTGNVSQSVSETLIPTRRLLDTSFGISYFNKRIRTGVAIHHSDKIFNKHNYFSYSPEISIYFGKIFSVNQNHKISGNYLIPEILYQYGPYFSQIYYGLHIVNNNFLTNVYLKQNLILQSLSGIISLGVNFKKFRISYAYEISFSKYIQLPIGSNQLMLKYNVDCTKKRKNQNTIYCLNF